MSLHVVILAAGQGKRMHSTLPKVLHHLAGKPLLERVIETAQQLHPDAVHVIYGHGGEVTRSALQHHNVSWIKQTEQLGTGHALLQAMPFITAEARVLVLSGDVPLIQLPTLKALVDCAKKADSLALLLDTLTDPSGLGRIIRDEQNHIQAIVEEKDATPSQCLIQEIYTGICCANERDLRRWLPELSNNNAQNEYYLTDIIAKAVAEKQIIGSLYPQYHFEVLGINNKLQLQELERTWQRFLAEKLLLAGVGIADAARIDIRGELICGKDVFIDVNCVFSGRVVLGDGCQIGPNCVINQSTLQADCTIHANSVLDGCELDSDCSIGPFARLRPGTKLASSCKIGNFVETKNAVFAEDCKASHLSYLGDVTLGKGVNIGAGTITCNYDGVNKHQTTIEEGVFVGSDTQFVAPVTVGAYATIGAGSTIRKDVPPGELTLTEQKQKTIMGWKRPVKKA